MTLNFPSHPDLPLENSPLKEVICQIKFPPLLEVAQTLPANFQKHVRDKFPQFEVRQNLGIDNNQPLPSEYSFRSSNKKSRVALGVNFLAITTEEYSHWEGFEKDLGEAINGLIKSYGEISVTRIGLRYINELNSKNTQLNTLDQMLGIVNDNLTHLALNDIWSLPKSAIEQLSLDDDENELTIRFAFENSPNPVVILDFDYFVAFDSPQKIETDDILKRIDEFHKVCYDAFRWSIKDDKLMIFSPKEGK